MALLAIVMGSAEPLVPITHLTSAQTSANSIPLTNPRFYNSEPLSDPFTGGESLAAPTNVELPILMYHHVGELPYNADTIRRGLTVSTANFETQMRFLWEKGYKTVSLGTLLTALQGREGLPSQAIILTFDDGYKDNFQNAYPILKRYGFTATFFVIARYIGRPEYLSQEDIREMVTGGMFVEAHGLTHIDLTTIPPAALPKEILEARQNIEAYTGQQVRFFSYPSGRYNETIIKVLRENNFWGAVTTHYGRQHSLDDAFQLKRIRVSGSDSLATFAAKLGGR
ncbi:MAG: polysaccharide deacetylase family protein [Chloroflexi bacterium]|nr:polysaccharide deacetylase family protein [Chloroflexota bacterium]